MSSIRSCVAGFGKKRSTKATSDELLRRVAGHEPDARVVRLVPRHAEEAEALAARRAGQGRPREEPGAGADAVAGGRLGDAIDDDTCAALGHVVLRREHGDDRRPDEHGQLQLGDDGIGVAQPGGRAFRDDAHDGLAVLQRRGRRFDPPRPAARALPGVVPRSATAAAACCRHVRRRSCVPPARPRRAAPPARDPARRR